MGYLSLQPNPRPTPVWNGCSRWAKIKLFVREHTFVNEETSGRGVASLPEKWNQ